MEYVHKNQSATVSELSEKLHVTRADVRYHLKELLAAGDIEKAEIIQPNWKGRPTRLFRLADKAKPGNYSHLAEALLSIYDNQHLTTPVIDQLAAHFARKILPAKQRPTQLNRLVKFFTDNAYSAVWEAYAKGPRIIFRNCPYAALLTRHPQLCAMDARIIEEYLNLHPSQVAKFNQKSGGGPTCIFLIEPGKK